MSHSASVEPKQRNQCLGAGPSLASGWGSPGGAVAVIRKTATTIDPSSDLALPAGEGGHG